MTPEQMAAKVTAAEQALGKALEHWDKTEDQECEKYLDEAYRALDEVITVVENSDDESTLQDIANDIENLGHPSDWTDLDQEDRDGARQTIADAKAALGGFEFTLNNEDEDDGA